MESFSAGAVTKVLNQLTKNCKFSARRNEESRKAPQLSCLQRHVWESLVKSKINLRAWPSWNYHDRLACCDVS